MPDFQSIIPFKIQNLVAITIRQKKMDFFDALEYIYVSALYQALTEEGTKLWHLSATKLFELLETEKRDNKFTYPDFV